MSIKRRITKGRQKKKLKMPILCIRDKFIYGSFILAGLLYFIFAIPAFKQLQNDIGFLSSDVIAVDGSEKYMFMAFWYIIFGVWIIVPLGNRRPIFGDKKIKYGPPKYPAVYPIFMKNKPLGDFTPKQYRARKIKFAFINLVIVMTFIISAVFIPQSVYERSEILEDGSVVVYDEKNEEISRYTSKEISKVEIRAQGSGRRGSRYCTVYFVLTTEDNIRFNFRKSCFKGESVQQIKHIIDLKKIYVNDCIIIGKERLEKSIDKYNLYSSEEKTLLKQLFEID
jgi:hypothetical protein